MGDHVDEQDDVEGPVEAPQDVGIAHVSLREAHRRRSVGRRSRRHRRRGEVDADSAGRSKGGQEVTGAAPDVEDRLAGRNARLQDARQIIVEVPACVPRALDAVVMLLVEAPDLFHDRLVAVRCLAQRSRL
jgi:hypothetical protein